MIYTIDEIITYNSDDCSLSHIPTQESLSLSISTGRLFERLLNSSGEILSRDTLLTEVWDNYGLRGSNSNLNQYLSILRRALAGFGCENLIITVPKLGIRLNTDIPIERLHVTPALVAEPEKAGKPALLITESVVEDEIKTASEPSGSDTSDKDKPVPSGYWLLLTLLFIALCSVTGWSYLNIHRGDEDVTPVTLNLKGGCQAVLMQGIEENEQPVLEKQLLQMLQENNQTCDADSRIYFDRNTSFSTRNYGRTILSSCKLNSQGHVISCNNFYYIDWRME